jgi:hypothetical protein
VSIAQFGKNCHCGVMLTECGHESVFITEKPHQCTSAAVSIRFDLLWYRDNHYSYLSTIYPFILVIW